MIFTICLLLSISSGIRAQVDTSLPFVTRIKGDIVDFSVDNLGNLYLFNSTGQLKKYNAQGDSVGVYNNVTRYGKLSYLDDSNPLRLLLYFEDFGNIVILDRFLNARNTIDLRKNNALQVKAVGLSYDNKVWVYDEFENKLKKLDEDGSLLFETADFRQLFSEPPSPVSVQDHEGLVFLYDSTKGVYVFDYYGALKNRLHLAGLKNFRVTENFLTGMRNDSLVRFQMSNFMLYKSALPLGLKEAVRIRFAGAKMYALKDGELRVYEIIQ